MWLKSNANWAAVISQPVGLAALALLAGSLLGCQAKTPQPQTADQQRPQRANTPQAAASGSGSERHSPALPPVGPRSPDHAAALPLPPGDAAAVHHANWQFQFDAILAGKQDTLLLDDQPITPQQLDQLAQLEGSLEQLLLDAGGVDGDALPSILVLKQLTHLRLRNCPLEDSSFEKLAASGLDHLRILNVPQARITARGIASLAGLPKLVQLRLGGRQIDDAAVAEIARLPELRSLHLIGPNLSDAALSELAQAPKLSSFYLDDCQLSDQAWEGLFDAKPRLHVHIDQQHHDRDPHSHRH